MNTSRGAQTKRGAGPEGRGAPSLNEKAEAYFTRIAMN